MENEQLELVTLAEMNFLGSMFLEGAAGNNEAIEKVKPIVAVADFVPTFRMGVNGRIYTAMIYGGKSDLISVGQYMFDHECLHSKELAYMVHLTTLVIGCDFEHYAEQVAKNAQAWRPSKALSRIKFEGGI